MGSCCRPSSPAAQPSTQPTDRPHGTMEQTYTTVLWRTCVAYCLGRVLLWAGQRALHRLDALYREVRESDQYEREWPLNRVECRHAGAK
jgi:hypothetical protein